MFGGKDAEMYNAMMSAFWECAGSKDAIYDWVESTPKTTMVVSLVDKLKEIGYGIYPINNKIYG